MPNVSDDFLKQLWQHQPVERESVTTEAVQRKLWRLQRRRNIQRVLTGIAITLMVAIIAALVATDRFSWSGIVLAGSVFFVCAWSYWLVHKHKRIDPSGVDRDLVSFVDYAIVQHQRQLSVGGLSGGWQTIVPSVLALLISIYITVRLAAEDLVLAGFLVSCVVGSHWLSIRERRLLQREVDNLKALRSGIAEQR